jgi:4-amino-4-deoxy-L-arabinose transferase-like glycosyltransferase
MDSKPPGGQPESPTQPEDQDASLHLRLEVPRGTRLRVTVETHEPDGTWLEQREMTFTNPVSRKAPARIVYPYAEMAPPTPLEQAVFWLGGQWARLLFVLALVVYLATRLIGLTDFPIFFFTDEAVQTVRAADLVRDNFKGYDGEILPAYFENGGQYNLGVSVYAQVLPYMMFGRSVFVTRAVSALLTVVAALAIAGILKRGFNLAHAWIGVFLLAVTPVWFLHSRTAFETALAASFYAAFLFAYLQYRLKDPRWLYAAVGLAALTFYTYSPAQMVVAATALLLFFSDLKHHWQNRQHLLGGLGLAILLAIPYVRFIVNHPGEVERHLTILDSYWVQAIPFSEKIGRFFGEYLRGLNPFFWFSPEPEGLARHIMKGYGHLWRWSLPLAAAGAAAALIKFRSPAHRVVLAALLAAPTGSALVGLGVTRLLFMVIPAVLLSAIGFSVGLDGLVRLIKRRWPQLPVRTILLLLTFLVISLASLLMLDDALTNGPFWYSDYGLAGMQYGARQIFSAVDQYIREHPGTKVVLSPSWSNGTDVVARFFYPEKQPFELGSIDGYIDYYREIDPQTIFVMIPEEFKRMEESGKFTDVKVEMTVNYPTGEPGWFFTRLRYVDNIEEIFAAEAAARRVLVEETAALPDGSPVKVAISSLDMGKIGDLFDGSPSTLVRTREANPLKLVVTFASPREWTGVTVRVGGVPTRLTVSLTVNGQAQPVVFTQDVGSAPNPRDLVVDFGGTVQVVQVTLEVMNSLDSEPAHVHLWEVTFR